MKRALILSILSISIGIFIGIFLVSNISPSMLKSIFGSEKPVIGAEIPPISKDESINLLNRAFNEASKAVIPTVVYINVETEATRPPNDSFHDFFEFFEGPSQPRRSRGSGSGVIISHDGYIVTNNHVVENASNRGIKVITTDKREFTAKLIGTDPTTDLAVLKIEADNLPVAHFGNVEDLNIGDLVLAVGNPLGLNSTVTHGIISAIGRGQLGRGGYNVENYIQTDAAINPGNSGGGLYNLYGSLIGINTAIATGTGTYIGYGFAIPIDIVNAVVSDLIEDGKVNRGYIGVYIKSVDELFARRLGLEEVSGVFIEGVVPGGAAEKAGLQASDVILEVDGKPVNTTNELQSSIVFYRAGDKIKLTIWRDKQKIFKEVTLISREDDDVAVAAPRQREEPKQAEKQGPIKLDNLGFTVEPLTNEIKSEYEVKNGVIVTQVERFSPAADRGLFRSGVITHIDKEEVKSPGQLENIIKSKESGEVILVEVRYPERNQIIAIQIP